MNMDHSGSSGPMCKTLTSPCQIYQLTRSVDALELGDTCFLASSWHVSSKGAFAGSVIGVFALCIAIEFARFYGRSYDRELIVLARRKMAASTSPSSLTPTSTISDPNNPVSFTPSAEQSDPLVSQPEPQGKDTVRLDGQAAGTTYFEIYPTWSQQIIRGLCYGSQFTASFIVMLFGMYFNGYILFAIFLGQTVGYLLFGKDLASGDKEGTGSGHCC